jgi:hypothetical protein
MLGADGALPICITLFLSAPFTNLSAQCILHSGEGPVSNNPCR